MKIITNFSRNHVVIPWCKGAKSERSEKRHYKNRTMEVVVVTCCCSAVSPKKHCSFVPGVPAFPSPLTCNLTSPVTSPSLFFLLFFYKNMDTNVSQHAFHVHPFLFASPDGERESSASLFIHMIAHNNLFLAKKKKKHPHKHERMITSARTTVLKTETGCSRYQPSPYSSVCTMSLCSKVFSFVTIHQTPDIGTFAFQMKRIIKQRNDRLT